MKHSGIITPMLTPFKEDGGIDYEATSSLLGYLKSIGIYGVFPLGSTGVFPFLSRDEKETFLKFVIENSIGMKVFSGIGSSSTQESIELAKYASDAGTDVNVLMPSYYIKPGQEEIKRHFSLVIEASDSPLFLYNIPQLTGVYINLETIEYLKENYSSVAGVKESSGDMRYFSRVAAMSSKDFSIFQGQDDLLLPSLSLGADGGVCGLTNFSNYVVKAYEAYRGGNHDRALSIQMGVINPLIKAVNIPSFPSGYYYAFYRTHRIDGHFRSPMTVVADKIEFAIDSSLEASSANFNRI